MLGHQPNVSGKWPIASWELQKIKQIRRGYGEARGKNWSLEIHLVFLENLLLIEIRDVQYSDHAAKRCPFCVSVADIL